MTFKTNENEFLAVGVPLDASDFEFLNRDTKYLTFLFGEIRLGLPTLDKWEILGSLFPKEKRLDFEAKEEWVATVADARPHVNVVLYRNYLHEVPQHVFLTCGTPSDSFITLIMSELKKEFPLEELPDRILILRLIAAGGTRVSASAVGDK